MRAVASRRLIGVAALLAGCSSSPGFMGGGGKDASTGGGADGGGGGSGYYAPAGYSLVPFLSEAPVRSFGAAGDGIEAGKDYLAVIETDVGRLVLDLTEDKTPETVNSFAFLARSHFYDGVAFHRVIEGFMAQTGDRNTVDDAGPWGTGGPGYYYGLEIDPTLKFNKAGVLGMARAQSPDSNGSQFFITFKAQPSLDTMYTVFGAVTEGADVLPKIVRGEPPDEPTRMTRVYVVAK